MLTKLISSAGLLTLLYLVAHTTSLPIDNNGLPASLVMDSDLDTNGFHITKKYEFASEFLWLSALMSLLRPPIYANPVTRISPPDGGGGGIP